jgi:hypothetical protein
LPNSSLFPLRAGALKFPRAAIALILFASVQFACSTGLFAQTPSPSPTPAPMDVTVNLGHGEEITVSEQQGSEQKTVPTVMLSPNQSAAITLQFSSDKVGAPVMVGTYDGGQISGMDQPVFVPADGAVPFSFQPGGGRGTYRVMVMVGGEQHLLRFNVKAPEE